MMVNNKRKSRYSLADLLAECKPDEPMPADMVEWEHMPDVGKELWPRLTEGSSAERDDQGQG